MYSIDYTRKNRKYNTVIWLVLLLFREWIMKFGSQAKPLVGCEIQTDKVNEREYE